MSGVLYQNIFLQGSTWRSMYSKRQHGPARLPPLLTVRQWTCSGWRVCWRLWACRTVVPQADEHLGHAGLTNLSPWSIEARHSLQQAGTGQPCCLRVLFALQGVPQPGAKREERRPTPHGDWHALDKAHWWKLLQRCKMRRRRCRYGVYIYPVPPSQHTLASTRPAGPACMTCFRACSASQASCRPSPDPRISVSTVQPHRRPRS